jgi:hypothetical protein
MKEFTRKCGELFFGGFTAKWVLFLNDEIQAKK